MNEQLQEIMRAHGLHKHISTDCQHRMDLLARLIVEECARIVEAQDVDPGFKQRMSWAIKRRFGLEL